MEHLNNLNAHVIRHVWPDDTALHAVADILTVSVARLKPTASQLADALHNLSAAPYGNPLHVTVVNREFLWYAQRCAHQLLSGYDFSVVVTLGLGFDEARILKDLTTEQIRQLAAKWAGEIFEVRPTAQTLHRQNLHHSSVPLWAAALATAN